ncbi:MAG: hypothetical protein WCS70_09105 [Verrucomicrobiota bacterium]
MSQGLCPSCGAAANLTAEQNQINCTYCGSVVTRQEAEAKLEEQKGHKFAGTLLLAETAQEGGSYEEAMTFWNEIIKQEPAFADAWLYKGNCLIWTSTIGNLKFGEAISAWKAAIKFAKNQEAMKKRVGFEIANAVGQFLPVLQGHFAEFVKLPGSADEHVARLRLLETALAMALEYLPTKEVGRIGLLVCERIEWAETFSSVKKAQQLKVKYVQLLLRIDPSYAKQQANKEALKSGAQIWGCRILGPIFLLGSVGGMQEVAKGKTNEIGGVIVVLLIALLTIAYGYWPAYRNALGKLKTKK